MPLGANKAAIMGVAGTAAAGDVVLLASTTASADSSISFTSQLTSTYGEYIFEFYNIHPATNDANFTFQSTAGGNKAMTTSTFRLYHSEAGSAAIGYVADKDQANGNSYQVLTYGADSDNDASLVGEFHLFNPASTTYAKHFYSRVQEMQNNDTSMDFFTAGYFNVTAAVTDIDFKFSTGNIDAGTIKLWGVK